MDSRSVRGPALAGPVPHRARFLLPLFLTCLVLLYEFEGKGRWVASGSLAERVLDILFFLLVGPLMAWWGLGMAGGLLQRLARSEAASEEKSRLLELRNRQLQIIIQASRAMSSVLDLEQVAGVVVEKVAAYTRFSRAALVLEGEGEDALFAVGSNSLGERELVVLKQALQGVAKTSSPLEWCRLTRQPVVVESLARDFRTAELQGAFAGIGVEAMIAAPLIWQERFRGVLMVFLDRSGPISTPEISLVSALAGQAALALENARLYTVTAQNRTRLDQAVEFLEGVAAGLARTRVGVSPLLQMVASALANLFEPAAIRLEVTKSGRRASQVVVESSGIPQDQVDRLSSAFTLPVTLDGEHFGQLEVLLAGEGRKVDPDAVQILQAFVHLTASALGNAALVSDLRIAVDEVERAYMGTLEALIKALEIRDHETEGHSRRVVQYTLALAQQLGVPEGELVPIMRGALLHDIGKIGVPDAILRKPGPLTDQEWAVMRQHARNGYEMLKRIDFLRLATSIILHHHERYDGSGYPDGLAGEQIPLGARIFAVADAYDAITSDRPYRKGRDHQVALEEIQRGAGTQFDARVVGALISLPEEELARIRGLEVEIAR